MGTSNEFAWARVTGGRILVPLDDFVGRSAYLIGDLDRKVTWVCQQLARPGDTVLDIGANFGVVTLALSKQVGPEGRVLAFEPNLVVVESLNQTLDRNAAQNVHLYPVALGAERAHMELSVPMANTGAGSLARTHESSISKVVTVKVCRLDDIVAKEEIASIRLIKIDVEGFETQVLEGASYTLSNICPQVILFELNQCASRFRDAPVVRLLAEYGYDFFALPKCLLRMRVIRMDESQLDRPPQLHDYIAITKGTIYEQTAAALRAA